MSPTRHQSNRPIRALSAGVALLLAVAMAPASAEEPQHVVHETLGFSIDVPENWTVLTLPDGFLANYTDEQGIPQIMLTLAPDQPGSEVSYTELREERTAEAARRSEPGDLMSVEDLEMEQGRAFFFLRRTAAGETTQWVHDFYVEAGGKIWKFNCLVRPTEEPEPGGEACKQAMRSFRVD